MAETVLLLPTQPLSVYSGAKTGDDGAIFIADGYHLLCQGGAVQVIGNDVYGNGGCYVMYQPQNKILLFLESKGTPKTIPSNLAESIKRKESFWLV